MEDWLGHRARTHAERPALIARAGIVTYAELDAGAARAALRLKALGVAPGARVATTLPAGVAFVELLHALPRVGASLVPLNTRLTGAERRAMGIEPLPSTLHEAISVMEKSELVADTLGEHVFDFFLRNKRAEWEEYRVQVSAFERDRMLPLI